jgi:endo-1,4-beta-xylanase
MIRVPGIRSFFARQNRVNFLVSSFIIFTILCIARADAQTIATYSFEDGTAQGWTSFNGASVPVATNAAAYAGSYSLLTTTGTTGQGGPSINVGGVLEAGAKYTITGYLRLTSGESATNANFTIRRSDPSCSGRPATTRSARIKFR